MDPVVQLFTTYEKSEMEVRMLLLMLSCCHAVMLELGKHLECRGTDGYIVTPYW